MARLSRIDEDQSNLGLGLPHAAERSIQDRVAQRLLELNRRFYDEFATPFAESRGLTQDGLQQAMDFLPVEGHVLDVGCGNGRLAHVFENAGRPVDYLGIDSAAELLEIARRQVSDLHHVRAEFRAVDITATGWPSTLPAKRFEAIAALALLHHLPGWRLRLALLAALVPLLDAGGVLLVSTWQFPNEERLLRKIVPWTAIGLSEADVEPGDVLVDWRRGGNGLRYCHFLDEAELASLARAAGLHVTHLYYADGRSHRLNLFGVLRPAHRD